jgi:hypothetical protein
MKKTVVLSLLVALTLSAQTDQQHTQENVYEKPTHKYNYTFVRAGYKTASGDYTVEDVMYDDFSGNEDEKGIELAFGVNSGDSSGGWRSILSLSSTSGEMSDVVDTSTVLFSGEFEFYLYAHKYFQPFIGFHGGIGRTKLKLNSYYDESLSTAQLGVSTGFSGFFTDNIGYYVKVSRNFRNHEETSYGEYINHNFTDKTFGLFLAF